MTDEATGLDSVAQEAPSPRDHQPPALRDLAERARGYAEAASSANTAKPMPPTGRILPAGVAAMGWTP